MKARRNRHKTPEFIDHNLHISHTELVKGCLD